MSEARHPIHGGPLRCRRGHALAYPNVLVGWTRCDCPLAEDGGHGSWQCVECGDVQPHVPQPP